MIKKRREKIFRDSITPDEIFLDSKNVSNFDFYQFEGKMESPIGRKTFLFIGSIFLLFGFSLLVRTGYLQIERGSAFAERSENNHLRLTPLYSERGLVYDRNDELLAWNDPALHLVLEKEVFVNKDLEGRLEDFFDFILSSQTDNFLGAKIFANNHKDGDFQKLIKKGVDNGEDLIVGTFYKWDNINDIYRTWSNYLPLRIDQVSLRAYKDVDGLAHMLGYVGYSSSANYDEIVGKFGIEKFYEDILQGENGFKMSEINSSGKLQTESIFKHPVSGEKISLSVDFKVQSKLHQIFSKVAKERGFKGAAGVVVDVETGEILAMTSYPEYSSQILSRGGPKETIDKYINDSRKPFLNRSVSGLYTPGSIIKPFVAVAALNEGNISPHKNIYSSGSISIPNPYNPELESVFKDWKAHGWVDMVEALAVSSNVYFFSIGGGYEDVVGLGIKKIQEYMRMFGLGEKTGIDLEGEAEGVIPGPGEFSSGENVWRIGDTYNVSIGQGNFQVTPLQMSIAVASLVNGGKLVQPSIIKSTSKTVFDAEKQINISEEDLSVAKKGMREAVLTGTAKGLGGLPVKVGAKTGTAELGASKKFVNSWIVGFWPYEKPKYAISVVLEKGPVSNLIGGVYVFRQFLEWMVLNAPEYVE